MGSISLNDWRAGSPSVGTRLRWLLTALAAVSVAALVLQFARREASAPPPLATQSGPDARGAALDQLPARKALDPLQGNLFTGQSWQPPAQPAVAAPAPQQPPANPYRFAGTLRLEGEPVAIFLASGDRIYEARKGEVLEGGYRVEQVTEDAVTLRHTSQGTRERILATWTAPAESAAGASVPPAPRR